MDLQVCPSWWSHGSCTLWWVSCEGNSLTPGVCNDPYAPPSCGSSGHTKKRKKINKLQSDWSHVEFWLNIQCSINHWNFGQSHIAGNLCVSWSPWGKRQSIFGWWNWFTNLILVENMKSEKCDQNRQWPNANCALPHHLEPSIMQQLNTTPYL